MFGETNELVKQTNELREETTVNIVNFDPYLLKYLHSIDDRRHIGHVFLCGTTHVADPPLLVPMRVSAGHTCPPAACIASDPLLTAEVKPHVAVDTEHPVGCRWLWLLALVHLFPASFLLVALFSFFILDSFFCSLPSSSKRRFFTTTAEILKDFLLDSARLLLGVGRIF